MPPMPDTHRTKLIRCTAVGLYCPLGDFHIDPTSRAPRAVITHAHADHARHGTRLMFTARDGAALLRARLRRGVDIRALDYGKQLRLGGVTVSLHPAGHVLGSAQIRIEADGEVVVVAGDYKLCADPTCRPFEPVRCDTFVTEATFAEPRFRWPDPAVVQREINDWWRQNHAQRRTSVIFAYAFGKAQRVLAGLDPAIGPILVEREIASLLPFYEAAGVALPPARVADAETVGTTRGRAVIIAPRAAARATWFKHIPRRVTAVVSGWMADTEPPCSGKRRDADRGFPLSDHADWPGILRAIELSGARHVAIHHGDGETLRRHLQDSGIDAYMLRRAHGGRG